MSPWVAVGSYPTLFTFTRHPRIAKIVVFFSHSAPSSASKREETTRLTIIGCREVLFLWYFPYPYGRSPLTTTVPCAARTFLLVNQAVAFQTHHYSNIIVSISPESFRKMAVNRCICLCISINVALTRHVHKSTSLKILRQTPHIIVNRQDVTILDLINPVQLIY